jgi:hypothetical protein
LVRAVALPSSMEALRLITSAAGAAGNRIREHRNIERRARKLGYSDQMSKEMAEKVAILERFIDVTMRLKRAGFAR